MRAKTHTHKIAANVRLVPLCRRPRSYRYVHQTDIVIAETSALIARPSAFKEKISKAILSSWS